MEMCHYLQLRFLVYKIYVHVYFIFHALPYDHVNIIGFALICSILFDKQLNVMLNCLCRDSRNLNSFNHPASSSKMDLKFKLIYTYIRAVMLMHMDALIFIYYGFMILKNRVNCQVN
ncbi:hypothetical protein ABZP36_025739 [Zizania latifolia]